MRRAKPLPHLLHAGLNSPNEILQMLLDLFQQVGDFLLGHGSGLYAAAVAQRVGA